MCSWVAAISYPLFPHAHCNKLFLRYNLLKNSQPKLSTAIQIKRRKRLKRFTENYKLLRLNWSSNPPSKKSECHTLIPALQIPMERSIPQHSCSSIKESHKLLAQNRERLSLLILGIGSNHLVLMIESLCFQLVVIESFPSSTLKQLHCC